jgi:hypothetical protein
MLSMPVMNTEVARFIARSIAERRGGGHEKDGGFTEELPKSLLGCTSRGFDPMDRFIGSCGRTLLRKRKFAKWAESRSESHLAETAGAHVVAVQSTDFDHRITEEGPDNFKEL